MTEQGKKALALLVDAVTDVVRAGGKIGVPGGTIYAALMAHGATLHQYEVLMDLLVKLGKVEKRGQLYFPGSAP